MNLMTPALLLLSLALPSSLKASRSPGDVGERIPIAAEWSSSKAQHVAGLPDAKAKDKGTLALSATELVFTGKASRSSIARGSIVAVSAGNERVEIWGMKGRVLRAVIPDGGGVAAAMFMHHQVDLLTIEFVDARGGYHAAVFLLPGKQAPLALEAFGQMPVTPRGLPAGGCADSFVRPHSVLLLTPHWDQAQVPAAYRALVYERLFERLQKVPGVDRAYREGEGHAEQGCPAYTVQLAVTVFHEGSQVKRAVLGPVGFFVGTTQMRFTATVTDAAGNVSLEEEIKATMRGETESTNVADGVAKRVSKDYAKLLQRAPVVVAADAPVAMK